MNVLDLSPNKKGDDLAACVRRAISRRIGAVFEIEVATRDGRRMLFEVSMDLNQDSRSFARVRMRCNPRRESESRHSFSTPLPGQAI
jgi:hypothetical protein